MKKLFGYISAFSLTLLAVSFASFDLEEWGFFAHKRINELAVYTLQPPMIAFYKKNIEYISDHAIDPDMRRHASKFEAVKHYIDIDHWGGFPFDQVPRDFSSAIIQYASYNFIKKDTSYRIKPTIFDDSIFFKNEFLGNYTFQLDSFTQYFRDSLMPYYYNDVWEKNTSNLNIWGRQILSIEVIDSFSDFGILPFSLLQTHYRLVNAMEDGDGAKVLRLSADYGHYIADAHVPLHTTENYNGQMTDQVGIHAFWETRIPELFSDGTYDYFVGKSEYIENVKDYVWDIVLDSHFELDSVLGIEKRLRNTFRKDLQYCYSERNNRQTRMECPEYAAAYQKAMGTMVEDRMRASIKAIGNLWYTAWIQAGQPDLKYMSAEINETIDSIDINKKQLGRNHSG